MEKINEESNSIRSSTIPSEGNTEIGNSPLRLLINPDGTEDHFHLEASTVDSESLAARSKSPSPTPQHKSAFRKSRSDNVLLKDNSVLTLDGSNNGGVTGKNVFSSDEEFENESAFDSFASNSPINEAASALPDSSFRKSQSDQNIMKNSSLPAGSSTNFADGKRLSCGSLPEARDNNRDENTFRSVSTISKTDTFMSSVQDGMGFSSPIGKVYIDDRGLTPEQVAEKLFHGPFRPVDVMSYLGHRGEKYIKTLVAYFKLYSFAGLNLVDALRKFTSTFYLKGESQQISRVLETFSDRYFEENPDVFPNSDCIYLLTTALVMLNTDLYNPHNSNNRKMTKPQFVKNTSLGLKELKMPIVVDGLLEGMYDSIKKQELILLEDDSSTIGSNNTTTRAKTSSFKRPNILRRRDNLDSSKLKAKSVNNLSFLGVSNPSSSNLSTANYNANFEANQESVVFEGYLCRKNVMDSRMKKSSSRSWKNVFVVLKGSEMYFYKPITLVHKVKDQLCLDVITVRHGLADKLTSYKNRENVFSVLSSNGALIYLQASSGALVNHWIKCINYMAVLHSAPPPPVPSCSLLDEFFAPLNPTLQSSYDRSEQSNFINHKLKSLESEFIFHSKILEESFRGDTASVEPEPSTTTDNNNNNGDNNNNNSNSIFDSSASTPAALAPIPSKVKNKMKINWERKRDFLNQEIKKYQKYQIAFEAGLPGTAPNASTVSLSKSLVAEADNNNNNNNVSKNESNGGVVGEEQKLPVISTNSNDSPGLDLQAFLSLSIDSPVTTTATTTSTANTINRDEEKPQKNE